jgi:Arc/MetJ-type ribon-helix-helix transcriptional regulator
MNDQMTRWTVVVDKKLDTDVRRMLAEGGGKKGDLSAFIKRAVQDALLSRMDAAAFDHKGRLTEAEADDLIEEALAETRKNFWPGRKWWSDEVD